MGKWNRNKSKTRRWQRNHLIARHGSICQICKKPFEKMRDITFDHIVPVSQGGDDAIENLQLAHFKCNQLKDDMTPREFQIFQQGGELVE